MVTHIFLTDILGLLIALLFHRPTILGLLIALLFLRPPIARPLITRWPLRRVTPDPILGFPTKLRSGSLVPEFLTRPRSDEPGHKFRSGYGRIQIARFGSVYEIAGSESSSWTRRYFSPATPRPEFVSRLVRSGSSKKPGYEAARSEFGRKPEYRVRSNPPRRPAGYERPSYGRSEEEESYEKPKYGRSVEEESYEKPKYVGKKYGDDGAGDDDDEEKKKHHRYKHHHHRKSHDDE